MRSTECAPATSRLGRSSALALGLALAFASPSALRAAAQDASPPALPPTFGAVPLPSVQPRFLVILDAAHGGRDSGAHLSSSLDEKNLVLDLSVRLRSILTARGLEVVTTRESDATVPSLLRAEIANRDKAAACVALHATASGSGVHLFTSSLPPAVAVQFQTWDAAQAPYIQGSLKLSSEINSAMTHAEIPVTLGRTSLQPLDNLTCPAVAVEIAPLTKNGSVVTPLSDSEYQKRILAALAAAVEAWHRDWSVQP